MEIRAISLGFVNCYFLKAETGFFLVDTGPSNQRLHLERELANASCRPGSLNLIVATHGDSDHVGNCAYLRQKYGPKIAIHRAEVEAVKSGDPVQNKKTPRTPTGMLIRGIMRLFILKQADRFVPDVLLEDGDDLSKYGLEAKVLHIPGHSIGSIGIPAPNGDLCCGDLLSNSRHPAPGFGIFDQVEFDATLERLKRLHLRAVYPGHDQPFAWEQFPKSRSG